MTWRPDKVQCVGCGCLVTLTDAPETLPLIHRQRCLVLDISSRRT